MWKVLLILSLVPLVAAWFGRHWFWTRVRLEGMRRDCETSVRELRERLGLPAGRGGKETHAAALGNAVRECGLALLEKEGNALAKARIKGGYLTRVLPALVAMFGVFAALSGRVPRHAILPAVFGFLAFWTLLRVTGMTIEWRAVARGAEALRAQRPLKRLDDEQEVLRCAKASVWSTVWPF